MKINIFFCTIISLAFFSNIANSQCYDLGFQSVGFDAIFVNNSTATLTYEFCNFGDPLPVDDRGGARINICPDPYWFSQLSPVTGSGTSFFTFVSDSDCQIGEQIVTIPTGCYEFNILLQNASSGLTWIPDYMTGSESAGGACVQGNLIPSGIMVYSSCNDSSDDGLHICVEMTEAFLPVELFDFTLEKLERRSILKWKTASEINNDFFTIERSSNGILFESIGKVNGNGTSTEINEYVFLDESPESGTNYYRLHQFDYNGNSEYSEIRLLNFDATDRSITIYPNPTVDNIQLNGLEQESTLIIKDVLGEEIRTMRVEEGQFVSIKDLNIGTYFISIVDDSDETIFSEKLIKI